MYVVIFTAQIRELDPAYQQQAKALRELAMSEYGCLSFTAVTEGEQEIALSYWPDLAAIKRWRHDLRHQSAQDAGRERWYRAYQVEIARIERRYSMASKIDEA